jgi:hypothetical protein
VREDTRRKNYSRSSSKQHNTWIQNNKHTLRNPLVQSASRPPLQNMSDKPSKGRPASEATPSNSSKSGLRSNNVTNRNKVTLASTKRPAKSSRSPELKKRIPRKSPTKPTPETPEDSLANSPTSPTTSTRYDSPISANLLASDNEHKEEDTYTESPPLSQPTSTDFFYGRPRCASLTMLFEREAQSTAARKGSTTTQKKAPKAALK